MTKTYFHPLLLGILAGALCGALWHLPFPESWYGLPLFFSLLCGLPILAGMIFRILTPKTKQTLLGLGLGAALIAGSVFAIGDDPAKPGFAATGSLISGLMFVVGAWVVWLINSIRTKRMRSHNDA